MWVLVGLFFTRGRGRGTPADMRVLIGAFWGTGPCGDSRVLVGGVWCLGSLGSQCLWGAGPPGGAGKEGCLWHCCLCAPA